MEVYVWMEYLNKMVTVMLKNMKMGELNKMVQKAGDEGWNGEQESENGGNEGNEKKDEDERKNSESGDEEGDKG